MPYYIRVLADNDAIVSATQLRARLAADRLKARLDIADGEDEDWLSLLLRHDK
jgi:hypothetical protein